MRKNINTQKHKHIKENNMNSNLTEYLFAKYLYKRLKKEEKDFDPTIYYFNYVCNINLSDNESDSNNYGDKSYQKIEIYKNCNLAFSFIISLNYPFVPPTFQIYDSNKPSKKIDYMSLIHNMNSDFFKTEIKKLGMNCLCNKTALCPGNWSPALRFSNLIAEYNTNRELVLLICNKYWFIKFCESRHICVDIIEYILKFVT